MTNSNNILGEKLDVLLEVAKDYKPDIYIEIGCYQCETLQTMYDELFDCKSFVGYDLFERAEYDELPPNESPITLEQAEEKCPFATFVKGDTKETLDDLQDYDDGGKILVFIDGGHSYETALHDVTTVKYLLPEAKVIVDDSDMKEVARALKNSGFEYEFLVDGLSLTEVL